MRLGGKVLILRAPHLWGGDFNAGRILGHLHPRPRVLILCLWLTIRGGKKKKNIEEFDSLPSKQCSLLDFKYMWLIEVREEELKIFLEITRNCRLLSQELLEHKHAQGQLTAPWLVPLKPKKQDA